MPASTLSTITVCRPNNFKLVSLFQISSPNFTCPLIIPTWMSWKHLNSKTKLTFLLCSYCNSASLKNLESILKSRFSHSLYECFNPSSLHPADSASETSPHIHPYYHTITQTHTVPCLSCYNRFLISQPESTLASSGLFFMVQIKWCSQSTN